MADSATEPPGVEEIKGWSGARLDEIGGASVGRVEGVYVDERTGEAEWLLARMGRFGRRSLVPARDAVAGAGHVWVPYTREVLRGAPRIEDETLDMGGEAELSTHYGIDRAAEPSGHPRIEIAARRVR